MSDIEKLNKVRRDLYEKLTPAEKIWMGEPSDDLDIKNVPWHKIYYKDDGSGDCAAYGRLLADGDELVFSFIVDKDHRRKKIGTMLLKEAIDFFNRSSKYKSLTYRVHKRNNPSISLVTKAGFSELSPKYLDKKIAESERVYILHKQGYLDIGSKKVKVNQKSTVESYSMPDDEDEFLIDDEDYRNDTYYTRQKRYNYGGPRAYSDKDDFEMEKKWDRDEDKVDDYWREQRERAPKNTEAVMQCIPKFMSLPIYGFKNKNYHCLTFTDHFESLFKSIQWDANTMLYAAGLATTAHDAFNFDDTIKNSGSAFLLWKAFRTMEIASSTLRKLGYLRSIHFYGVQPGYHGFGFTEFHDNKLNSFISSDFHTVLNPYEYIIFGHPVHATMDGEVIEIVNKYPDKPRAFTEIKFDKFLPSGHLHDYMGNQIVIKHNNLVRTVYANIKKDSFLVKVGQQVKKGQMICRVGCSGTFRSPFLLFMIRTGDLNVPMVGKYSVPLNILDVVRKKLPFMPNMWNTHYAFNLMTAEEEHGKFIDDFSDRFDCQKINYKLNGTIIRDCSLVKQFPNIMVE